MDSYIRHRQVPNAGPAPPRDRTRPGEAGFSILETTIALLLIAIVGFGSMPLFLSSIYNNSAGSDRATALAIGQQVFEQLRSAQFNLTSTDPALAGGTSVRTIVQDGRTFSITKTIDDDSTTAVVNIDPTTTLKLITVTVTPQSIGRGWAWGAGGSVTLITERAKKNY